ncbi:hypothetical protein B484DRAFT_406934 [Ochromonadaceae sp. CCMP2298]|nr:hypothetical protein B484DRAFT_406934 [Ochromonadaceae sp. CCMP2298]
MLARSPFVLAAVRKPPHTYLLSLLTLAPLHLPGLLLALGLVGLAVWVLVGAGLWAGVGGSNSGSKSGSTSGSIDSGDSSNGSRGDVATQLLCLRLLCLSAWPLSFLVGLTAVAAAGSGFQLRFLLPTLPGLVLLGAVAWQWAEEAGVGAGLGVGAGTAGRAGTVRRAHLSTVGTALCTCIHLVLLYSALHSLYYLLYAPLFADLDVTLPDILASLVSAPFQAPSREQFQDTMLFMRHFGLLRKVR